MIQGRDGELAEIGRVLAGARAGHGGALVVRGETGIGKTALLRAVDPAGMLVLRYTGVESEVELGFAALQTLLAPLPELPDALTAAFGQGSVGDLPVFTALLRVLGRQPVVVVVDDAHYVDRASLAALLFVARRVRDLPVAVIFSARDDLDTADLPQVRLTGLSGDAARSLLGHVPAGLRDRLVEVTGGNPLALVELGDVSPELVLQGTVPLSERLRTAFLARVRGLSAESQELLLIVAAEDSGDLDVVRAAAGGDAFPEDLLVVEGRTVRFRHPLVRSAVYSSASGARRREAHRAIAEHVPAERARWHRALATVGSDEELAGELERDAHALADRGGVAAVASALRRAALISGSDVGRTRRMVGAAYAAWKSGQAGLARTLIAETHGQAADSVTRLRLAQVKGLVDLYGGDQLTAYSTLVRSAGEMPPAEGAYTLFMASEAAFHANRVDDAATAALGAGDLDPACREYGTWLAGSFVDGGSLDPWVVAAAAPPTAQRSLAHRWVLPMAIAWHGCEPRQAREFGLAACADIRANGMLAILAIVLPWLAEIEYRLALFGEGRRHALDGLLAARDCGYSARAADCLGLLARFAAVQGDASEARAYAADALAAALPLHNNLAAGHATLALVMLALAEGDEAAAAGYMSTLEDSGSPAACDHLARAGRSGEVYPFEHARTLLERGRKLRRERRTSDARTPLRQATELFDSLGCGQWAEVARGELRACGGAVVRNAAELTSQELQVARLAAVGLSNKEIGARLFVSPRTVGYHLYKIFPKLGIATRSQLRDVRL